MRLAGDYKPIMNLLNELPPYELRNYTSSIMYGADYVAASYCGLKKAPSSFRGIWQHGWHPSQDNIHPLLITDGANDYENAKKKEYFWVTRKDQEDFFHQNGFEHVRAIGLPLIYTTQQRTDRIRGSLLVMPSHSVAWTTHRWNFEEYAENISTLRNKFKEIIVCVHPTCWERGYWVDAFRKRNFPVIKGAIAGDKNSLIRMRMLFDSFEYVTTNGFGSLVAYAAYCGAKPSIFGSYAQIEKQDYANLNFLVRHPELLDCIIHEKSKETLQKYFPFLFCDPQDAVDLTEWGREQLGEPFRVSPAELQKLFGWGYFADIKGKTQIFRSKGLVIAERIATAIGEVPIKNVALQDHLKFRHVTKLERNQPGRTKIDGKPFEFADGRTFISAYNEIIRKGEYRFSTTNPKPNIIDGSASTGLSILYFKKLYPDANILAVEPNPELFGLLAQNHKTYNWEDVKLVQARLGTTTSSCEKTTTTLTKTPTLRLHDLLEETDSIDFLRLDLADIEESTLDDCEELLKKVKYMTVRYYSNVDKPQSLHHLLCIINNAGFRIHQHVLNPSPQPLFVREVQEKSGIIDMILDIFCYRA